MNSDLIGTVILIAYYLLVVVLVPVILKFYFKVPTEYVRKLHHIAYSMSIFLLLNLFSAWYLAVSAALILAVIGYPALLIMEKSALYKKLFVDRQSTLKAGELRKQLIYVQFTFAVLIFIFWGLLGPNWQFVAAVAVMGWGFGDAAAALVGKVLGRTNNLHRYIEKAKSLEGTTAMILIAGLAVFLTLFFYGGITWFPSLLVSILVAPVCGLVELFSRNGSDTLTVPLSAAALIFPLTYLFSSLGL